MAEGLNNQERLDALTKRLEHLREKRNALEKEIAEVTQECVVVRTAIGMLTQMMTAK